MSVEYLREFVVLAEKLNFTSASKALNITQPALSNHIKSLEREFGFVLLERSSSEGARLTKAGRVVYERSERLVRAYEEMVEDARKVQREVSGRIVLQLPRSELCGELIMAVKDFMAHHPNIDVDIRPWCQADSLDEIEAGRIDCGYFGPLVGEHSSLDECGTCRLVPLVQSEFLLFVPKDGPYAKAGSFPVEDLSRFNIAVQANQKNRTWSALVRNVCRSLSVEPSIVQRYGDSVEDMFLNSLGPSDVVLASESSQGMLSFSMLDDRVLVPLDPPVKGVVHAVMREPGKNEALACFVGYLERRWADRRDGGDAGRS